MSNPNHYFFNRAKHPVKAWLKGGVNLELEALEQAENLANMPFIHKHVALMPDVHVGIGATVGSVIATKGAIVPAAVGVDIGCGMMAVKTTLMAKDLPDNLHQTRLDIEAAVPHGRTDNGGDDDKGSWSDKNEMPYGIFNEWQLEVTGGPESLRGRYNKIVTKHPKVLAHKHVDHLGTLGTGNHFIELCLDEDQHVWIMLHSGSRGPGNKIGQYFIEAAKREMERYFIGEYLPDRNLSYLVEHTDVFDDYVEAVHWAQDFARMNREIMMQRVVDAMRGTLPAFTRTEVAVNCHHNYVEKEHHFGANVLVTRKGAVRARSGDLGIIPGSMGTGSFIVRGRGNPDSFHSCSHGAGRVMSRTAAHKVITMEEHAKAMVGIEARLDKEVLDESPAAYKDVNLVMEAQNDLVEIVHRLKQVLNVKG